MQNSYFSNTVVVITGAASGIGREVALQASALGATVVAADINQAGLEETHQLAKNKGNDIETHVLDVANKNAIIEFSNMVMPALNGRKLILINNAGVGLYSGNFNDTNLEDIEWLININFWGPVRLTKAFYSYFIKQNEGHIVNISSVFGLGGFAYQSAYSPSKFALRGFTETLRMELLGTNIITTSVHPGGIKTNITKNSRAVGPIAHFHQKATEQFAEVAKTTPQEAARQILKAIQNKKQRLLIGPDARLIDIFVRLFPVSYSRFAKKEAEKAFSDPYK